MELAQGGQSRITNLQKKELFKHPQSKKFYHGEGACTECLVTKSFLIFALRQCLGNLIVAG